MFGPTEEQIASLFCYINMSPHKGYTLESIRYHFNLITDDEAIEKYNEHSHQANIYFKYDGKFVKSLNKVLGYKKMTSKTIFCQELQFRGNKPVPRSQVIELVKQMTVDQLYSVKSDYPHYSLQQQIKYMVKILQDFSVLYNSFKIQPPEQLFLKKDRDIDELRDWDFEKTGSGESTFDGSILSAGALMSPVRFVAEQMMI